MLNASQAAMIVVRDSPDGATVYELAKTAEVSQQQIYHARTVLDRRPDLVDSVISGALSLNKAQEEARNSSQPRPKVMNLPVLHQKDAEAQLDPKHDLDPDVRAALAKRLCDAHSEEMAVRETTRALLIESRTRKQQLMGALADLSAAELDRLFAAVGVDAPEPDREPLPPLPEPVDFDDDSDINDNDNDDTKENDA